MATQRMRIIPGAGGSPDDTGDVFWQPYSIVSGVSGDRWQHQVLTFRASGASAKYYGTFHVPMDYLSSPKIVVKWTAAGDTGEVKWTFDYRAVAVGEGLDEIFSDETGSTTDLMDTLDYLADGEISFTAANFAPEDTVEFFLERDSSDAADTVAAPVLVVEVLFEYGT